MGGIKLTDLTPRQVQSFYGDKLNDKLSSKTVTNIHTTPHRALKLAVDSELSSRNVCGSVSLPRRETPEVHPLNRYQAKALLDTVEGDREHVLYVLAVTIGMRQGELLGLFWSDLDLSPAKCVQDARSVPLSQGYRTRDGQMVTVPLPLSRLVLRRAYHEPSLSLSTLSNVRYVEGKYLVLSVKIRLSAFMVVGLLAMMAMALSTSAEPAEAQSTGDTVVGEAEGWYGTPYSFPYGIDCTGFTSTVYAPFGVYLPDTPVGQMSYGIPVANPGPGDLVFFSEGGSGYITHVGIATGYGTVIHSSDYYGYVTETPIQNIPGYVGARSIL